ncbi:MAG: helix-turn-helix domain-containing protein [Lacrimispora sp.]|uniref:MarR family transcriptional regulator n=1 Tax=Lacrimispora sp. TaxID=2719234 RepID=UPI0039E6920F
MDKNYETVRRIMLATNKIDGVYYLLGKNYGINENTLAFLYALTDGKPHSQKEISDEWIIPRTTINSIVKTMLAEGYIMFCSEQHTKEKAIVLTESGRKYADRFLKDIYSAEEKAIIGTLENYPPEFVSALEEFGNRLYQEFHEILQNKKEHIKHEQF